MAGPISEAMVEVGADLRPFSRQMKDGLDKAFSQVEKVANRAESVITKAFDRASQGVRRDLSQLGNTRAFDQVSSGAADAAGGMTAAFAAAQQAVDAQLRDIGGPDVWLDLQGEASRASAGLVAPFAVAQQAIDSQLRDIGGPDVWAPLQAEAAAAGARTGAAFSAGAEATDGGGGGMLGRIGAIRTALLLLPAAAATAGGALAGMGIKGAAEAEGAQISFETMLGSAEKAEVFLNDLRAMAAETPFEFPELRQAASSLVSAGIEADKVIPIMTTLGDVTSGMGTGSEGVQRATIALQQMAAAGRITGEDLNQLRDAGIPVFDLLAAATGKTKEEVAALAQQGKLGKEELDQVFTALEEGGAGLERFSGLMEKQSQSLSGLWSSFTDNAGLALTEAMAPAIPILKDALDDLGAIIGPALAEIMPGIGAVVGSLAEMLGPMVQGFAEFLGPILESVGAMFTLLGPVIVQVFDELGPELGRFAEALGGLLVALIPVFDTLLGVGATVLGAFLDALTPVIEAIAEVLPPILEALQPAFKALSPVLRQLGTLLGGVIADAIVALAPVVVTLAEGFAGLLTQLAPLISAFLEKLEPVMPDLIDAFVRIAEANVQLLLALSPLIPPLTELALILIEKIGAPALIGIATAFANMAEAVAKVVDAVVGGLVAAGEWLREFFDVEQGVGPNIIRFKDGLHDLGVIIGDVAQTIVGFFTGLLEGAWNAIEGVIGFIASIPGRAWDALSGLGSLVYENVVQPFIDAATKVGEWIESLLGYVAGLPGRIIEKGSELFSAAAEWAGNFLSGLVSALGGVIEGAGDLVESLLNALKGAWNGLVDFINDAWNATEFKLSAFGASVTIGLPDDVPADYLKLARGATIDGPTFAMLGDATWGNRRESVIPHNDPIRAVQVAREGGLLDVLARGGLFDSSGGSAGTTISVGSVNLTPQKSAPAHAMEFLDELAMAAWMKGASL